MKPSAHALTLTSTNSRKLIAGREFTLYDAACSCGATNPESEPASGARAWHDAHLQRHLGPEAQEAREASSC